METGQPLVSCEVLDHVVRERRSELLALAYAVTADREQAEDVVQEVLTRLTAMGAGRLAQLSDVYSYACRAVINEARSWHRSVGAARRRQSAAVTEWQRRLATQPDLYGRAEILDLVRMLRKRERIVVACHYFLDLDDTATAEILGCAPASVRSLRMRSLRKMRQQIDREGVRDDGQ